MRARILLGGGVGRQHEPHRRSALVLLDPDLLEPGTDVHAIVCDQVVSVTPLTWQQTAITDWMPARDG